MVVCALGFAWTCLYWFQPARHWPGVGTVFLAAHDWLAGWSGLRGRDLWALKSCAFTLPAIGAAYLLGLRPAALGAGRTSTYGWRIVALSFVIAFPFLVWLGLQPSMQAYYSARFAGPDLARHLLAGAIVIAVEHAFIEGLVLSLALPPGAFAADRDPRREGRLAVLGFGYPAAAEGEPRDRSLGAWLGVPPGAWPAIVGQAIVFGLVHATKSLPELVTSFPGGLGLGILTWRIHSVWPSVLLHFGTGAVAVITMRLAVP